MPTNDFTILLAEDDDDDAMFILRALKEVCPENEAIHVHDGEDAVHYLKGEGPFADRRRFAAPALLLLDLKMPGEDGFYVLEWLRDHPQADLPVIVLTGSAFPQEKDRALELGAREFHEKPVAYEDTLALIKGICSRWLALDGVAAR